MDKALRSQINTIVVRCRALLEEDLGIQLEGAYGVHGDGRVEPLAGLTWTRWARDATLKRLEIIENRSWNRGTRREREYISLSVAVCANTDRTPG